MHPADMGKRGDQLVRVFDEPVEPVITQHCSKIANSVVRIAEIASDEYPAAATLLYCRWSGHGPDIEGVPESSKAVPLSEPPLKSLDAGRTDYHPERAPATFESISCFAGTKSAPVACGEILA
jgi:hypothetical protein